MDLTSAYAAYLANRTDEPTPRELAQLRTPPDLIGWLRGRHRSREAAEQALAYVREELAATSLPRGPSGELLVFDRPDVRLLAPQPRPNTLRDFSIFKEHMTRAEGYPGKRPAWYRHPPYYKGNPEAIIGPEDPIPYPYYSEMLDLELEIGIVIGREGRNLSLEEAKEAIAGYTILIDCSARDPHLRQAEFLGPAKMKDWATVLGPCLVTADEVDEASLDVRITVDGEVWFEGNSSAPRLNGPDYPATLGIMRPVFHRVLADATREAGMQVRLGVTVEAIEPRPRLSRRSWPRRPAIPPSG